MKYYIYTAALGLLALSCVRFEEEAVHEQPQTIAMRLTAFMDPEEAITKTYLDGKPVVSVRNTYWLPDDAIGVTGNRNVVKFENICEDTTSVAVFDGQYESLETYYAFYPYSEDASFSSSDTTLTLTIPQVQKYQENTFATDVVPMVAKFNIGDSLYFKNICGGFVVKMTGTQKITNLRLTMLNASGDDAKVAGKFKVDLKSDVYPMISTDQSTAAISIDCGDGVRLDPTTPTAFHFILPPAEYKGVKLVITSSDGERMIKSTEKSINIRRSNITYASSFAFEKNIEPTDLSALGNSNCHIVPEAGVYSFDATVIGNGVFGMVDDAGFHTDDYRISPKSVEVLWQDRDDVIYDVTLNEGRVHFFSDGLEGNALVAVKDELGNILWSWHIWATDQPSDLECVNSTGTYFILDRNLGATRSDRGEGDEWKESIGALYQWGRKDPFMTDIYRTNHGINTIEESILHPAEHASLGSWYYQSHWEASHNNNLWNSKQKTIYDPCPPGYIVADNSLYHGISIDSEPDQGYNILISSTTDTWFPITPIIWSGGSYKEASNEVIVWTSSVSSNSFYRLHIKPEPDNSTCESLDNAAMASPVRCKVDKESNTYDINILRIDKVNSSSAEVSGNICVDGTKNVVRRGFVYGMQAEPTIERASVVDAGTGDGDFSAYISNLSGSTKYYIRAFAEVANEIIYSNVRSFYTPGSTGVIDLSAEGTSNSYVISQAGTYKFKATLKGNSTEPIAPSTAEVVWETLNTSDAVTQGSIIASVSLEDGYVKFTTPSAFTPGNALIAVKSAGKVVWSWHIWAVESDPEVDAHLYPNGTLLMDRNLGALSVAPGDVRSFGLFYQWGRKDPFVGCGNSTANIFAATYPEGAIQFMDNNANYNNYNYVEAHPNHFIKRSNWNSDPGYWGAVKTMYDPCPVGWRVPDIDSDVWAYVNSIRYESGGAIFALQAFESDVYYPYSGYINLNGDLSEVNSVISLYTATSGRILRVTTNNISKSFGADNYNGCVVRCMKDAEYIVSTGPLEDIFVSDTYLVVPGELTIMDDTVMDAVGVVCSTIDSAPKLGYDSSSVIDTDAASLGTFSVTVTGLKPNTKYWVRTYAKGGHNIRYGAVREVWTKVSTNNEGYGSEDFEW